MTIRFIIKRRILDAQSGAREFSHETIDGECPELERALTGGTFNQRGYDTRELVGTEILPATQEAAQ